MVAPSPRTHCFLLQDAALHLDKLQPPPASDLEPQDATDPASSANAGGIGRKALALAPVGSPFHAEIRPVIESLVARTTNAVTDNGTVYTSEELKQCAPWPLRDPARPPWDRPSPQPHTLLP